MKPNPNEVLSQFREGKDTCRIALHFGIKESEAYNLLDEARRKKFEITFDKNAYRRGGIRGSRAAAVAKRKRPVTLVAVSFLGSVRLPVREPTE